MTSNGPLPMTSRGFTMIEVLITLVIVAIGLLGLAGLQMTSMNSQFEAYQRAQALYMLEEMSNRIRVNAIAARAGAYAEGSQYGLLDEEDCDAAVSTAARDLCEWNDTLAGSGVTLDGQKVGSVIGSRACIENVVGSVDGEVIIRLTVAWMGMAPTVAPASTCGLNAYGEENERFRRTASLDAVLANLAP